MAKIEIRVYEWAGQKWFFKIRTKCKECSITNGIVKSLIKELKAQKKIDYKLLPWLDNIFTVFFRYGGWHAPVLVVDGKIFCQGTFPDRKKLKKHLQKLLRA